MRSAGALDAPTGLGFHDHVGWADTDPDALASGTRSVVCGVRPLVALLSIALSLSSLEVADA